VFVGGYAARAMMWRGVNRAQESVMAISVRLSSQIELLSGSDSAAKQQLAEALHKIPPLTPTLTRKYEGWPIIAVLLSIDKWRTKPWLPVSTVILLLYNGLRFWLTKKVSALREEEDRSGFAPRLEDYRKLWTAHAVGNCLIVFVVASFVCHAAAWVFGTVYLPA
jgi:hypothetical protein